MPLHLRLLLGTDWHTELLPFFVRKPTLTVFVCAEHAIEVVREREPVVALKVLVVKIVAHVVSCR
jgi:hypothetical protein